MKKCCRCKKLLEISLFNKNRSNKDGLSKCCIVCSKEYRKGKKYNYWIPKEKITVYPNLPAGAVLLESIPEFKYFSGYCIDQNGILYTCLKRQHGFYDSWKVIKTKTTVWGYEGTNICYKSVRKDVVIHRLVALAFIPNPGKKPCVNHIDSNRKNNLIDNLEWVTYKENSVHALDHGNLRKGETVGTAVLTEVQALQIINMRASGEKVKSIASLFNVSIGTIESIIYKKSWKHLTCS